MPFDPSGVVEPGPGSATIRQVEREVEITRCLQALGARSARLRTGGAKRLGELRARPDALLIAMNDTSGLVRAAAAEALGFACEAAEPELIEEAIDALLSAIDDSNDYVVSAAITSLGRLKATVACDEISDCLEDENPHIVEASILALARLGVVDAAESFLPFLDSPNEYIQSAAARAMSMLGYRPAGPALLKRLEEGLHQSEHRRNEFLLNSFIQALAHLDVQEAVPLFVEIAHSEVGLRSKAVQALIELKAENTVSVLSDLFADPSIRLRHGLVRMVIQAGYVDALPVVRPLLRESHSQLRQAALEAVVSFRDPASIDTIRWMCYHDSNPYLRIQAVHSLATLVGEACLPDLLALIGDPNTYLRRAVAEELGNFEYLPAEARAVLLERIENDPVSEVVDAARLALASHASLPEDELRSVPPPPPPPVPQEILPVSGQILDLLERWQKALPGMARQRGLESLAETDRALTRLIGELKEALRMEED